MAFLGLFPKLVTPSHLLHLGLSFSLFCLPKCHDFIQEQFLEKKLLFFWILSKLTFWISRFLDISNASSIQHAPCDQKFDSDNLHFYKTIVSCLEANKCVEFNFTILILKISQPAETAVTRVCRGICLESKGRSQKKEIFQDSVNPPSPSSVRLGLFLLHIGLPKSTILFRTPGPPCPPPIFQDSVLKFTKVLLIPVSFLPKLAAEGGGGRRSNLSSRN